MSKVLTKLSSINGRQTLQTPVASELFNAANKMMHVAAVGAHCSVVRYNTIRYQIVTSVMCVT